LVDEAHGNFDPFAIWAAMMTNEKPGGHGERSVAVGAIDMAVWDAVAKIAGVPLYKLLADRYRGGVHDDSVWVYAAGGYYYPGKDHAQLQAEMRGYRDRGYEVVKMKIGGAPLATDIARIEAVLEVVGTGANLAVDANGRFDAPAAIAYAEALKPYGLFWYEEAGDPLDYALQAELANHYDLPMATGENLFSHQDARNLLRHGGMRPDRDWLQFDCALSYGLVEYMRTLAVMDDMGWSSRRVVPHGGHQMSLNIAAGLHLGGNESYPEVFQPFGGFADGIAVEAGRVGLPQIPGVGFEAKANLRDLMATLTG
jgi:L-alanine-DL-glutamate epimerase-like enolase superfamily enzyme